MSNTHFTDSIEIVLKSGKGGAGSSSFRREKYIPKGGPDGGDGGKGGNIVFRSIPHERTLRRLRFKSQYVAKSGYAGQGKKKHGADAEDLIIEVPFGTVVKTMDDVELVRFDNTVKEYHILKGGKGGKGNVHFKSSVRQAPEYAQPGMEGSELCVRVELELAADICFLGSPNVGKSTLLKALTNADPKIANYPFTTLIPNLGTLRNVYAEKVLVDIPGILSGAAEGYGLGTSFLRHIRKVTTICYVLDISIIQSRLIHIDNKHKNDEAMKLLYNSFKILQNEVLHYDSSFVNKYFLVVCNKIDCLHDDMSFDYQYVLGRLEEYIRKNEKTEIIIKNTDMSATYPAKQSLVSLFHKVFGVSALHFMGMEAFKEYILHLDSVEYGLLVQNKSNAP